MVISLPGTPSSAPADFQRTETLEGDTQIRLAPEYFMMAGLLLTSFVIYSPQISIE